MLIIYGMNINNIQFRLWRKKNKLTQAQVAKAIGVTTRTINNWECKEIPQKRNKITLQTIEALMSGEIKVHEAEQ